MTDLQLTRYIATQLRAPLSLIRSPKPGINASQWTTRPFFGGLKRSTMSRVRTFAMCSSDLGLAPG